VALAGAATLFYRWTTNGNPDRQADILRSVAVTSYPGAERFPIYSQVDREESDLIMLKRIQ
jgi:hypothetical protein